MPKVTARYWWFALSGAIVLGDQLSKWWVIATMQLYQRIELLPFLQLTYVHNKGAAFSFLSDAGGWQHLFFVAIASLASIALSYWLWRVPAALRWQACAFALILGGAIGNLIDRLRYGYVIDFIDFYVRQWHWPVFNLADSAITLGVAALCLDILRKD